MLDTMFEPSNASVIPFLTCGSPSLNVLRPKTSRENCLQAIARLIVSSAEKGKLRKADRVVGTTDKSKAITERVGCVCMRLGNMLHYALSRSQDVQAPLSR